MRSRGSIWLSLGLYASTGCGYDATIADDAGADAAGTDGGGAGDAGREISVTIGECQVTERVAREPFAREVDVDCVRPGLAATVTEDGHYWLRPSRGLLRIGPGRGDVEGLDRAGMHLALDGEEVRAVTVTGIRGELLTWDDPRTATVATPEGGPEVEPLQIVGAGLDGETGWLLYGSRGRRLALSSRAPDGEWSRRADFIDAPPQRFTGGGDPLPPIAGLALDERGAPWVTRLRAVEGAPIEWLIESSDGGEVSLGSIDAGAVAIDADEGRAAAAAITGAELVVRWSGGTGITAPLPAGGVVDDCPDGASADTCRGTCHERSVSLSLAGVAATAAGAAIAAVVVSQRDADRELTWICGPGSCGCYRAELSVHVIVYGAPLAVLGDVPIRREAIEREGVVRALSWDGERLRLVVQPAPDERPGAVRLLEIATRGEDS